ncbi:hypothetical protein LCGC14_1463400 [marine sediment metagenome]|uniref:Uncharacterized protein n=1 Tax=marine sediment metagenome TaxID=412755 RepID=A0A0F9LUZ7_9ZZZZ
MGSLDQVVTISITKDTATLTRVGFGTPAILTYNVLQAELAKLYGSIDEIQAPAGPFPSTSREVAMATAIFAQNPKPAGVVLLRRPTAPTRKVTYTPITDVTAGKPFALFAYSITLRDGVNSETFIFTTGATPTVAAITLGLVTLINAGTVNVKATDGVADFAVESAATPGGVVTPGVPFTSQVDRALITQAESTVDPGIGADLAAARLANDNWYALMSDATSPAEIESLAVAIRPLAKIYLADSSDDDILGPGSSDIGSTLQASAEERTLLFSHPEVGTDAPSCAWAGRQLPSDPGSTTWKFKTLTGVTAQQYSAAEIANLDGKSVNYYTPIAGLNITIEGVMASGEFVDIVRGIDALEQRMQENVFRVFVVSQKVSYTDLGIQTQVNAIEGTLRSFTGDDNLLAPTPPFVVTFPRASEVDPNDKASRLLTDIDFTATFSGAVHKTEIRGRVTV